MLAGDHRGAPDPLSLTRTTILLPTRRACRALRDAFLRVTDGAALLLPKLMPLGDVDVDEIELRADGAVEEPATSDDGVPSALPGLRRQLLLTRLIRADDDAIAPAQAAQLARELARLLDQVATERLDLTRLRGLVPEDYATHWQKTLAFLSILTERWPAVLRLEGAVDAADRRNAVLAAQAALWRATPPDAPVIAAGTTGSIPATADLLAVIAALPTGAIVLPGLDQTMTDDAWAKLEPGHPQFGLKALLERLEVARAAVAPWPVGDVTDPARARWLSCAMLPAEAADDWRRPGGLPSTPLTGVARIDCANPQEEAGLIALALREALERPGRTAALVTPDRSLARRVTAELARFGIAIDDSAGQPLDQTPPGVFLRLLADAVAAEDAPVPLLALLKHPLAAAGREPGAFRRRVRELERRVLRGPRPGLDLAGLADAIARDPELREEARDRLAHLVDQLARLVAPFGLLLGAREAALGDLLRCHLAVAEALAATADQRGADRLWSGDAGEAAADWIADLLDAARSFPPLDGADYPALFGALIQGQVVRPRYGRHPRLAILGPLEARLQHADRVILGGLNEGTWPAEAPVDAWLSRPMRAAFGLPAPERRIGLAAHDFAQAFCAPEVVLTRAAKVDGTPTVPSRWLQRLAAVLEAAGERDALTADSGPRWLAWQRGHAAAPPAQACPPPAPRPPLSARPRKLSVTAIERWMRDPYAIFARYVLALKALDPLDDDPGAAERGLFIHHALDRFVREHPDALPPDAVARLLEIGRQTFGASLDRPAVWAFWWPRFGRVARWFVAEERARRTGLAHIATECKGELVIAAAGGPFTLTATADRIERRHDGSLAIIDYKTGAPPKWDDVTAGLSPQLPLEAVIAEAGGFGALPRGDIIELAYWRLSGGDPPGEIKPLTDALAPVIDAAARGLRALIERFDDPATAYPPVPRPDKAPAFSDYAHLARLKEWAGGEDAA